MESQYVNSNDHPIYDVRKSIKNYNLLNTQKIKTSNSNQTDMKFGKSIYLLYVLKNGILNYSYFKPIRESNEFVNESRVLIGAYKSKYTLILALEALNIVKFEQFEAKIELVPSLFPMSKEIKFDFVQKYLHDEFEIVEQIIK